MSTGEWLTRGTVWGALTLYTAGELAGAAKQGRGCGGASRWLSSIGCAVFFAHVACAFHFYHHWSHAAAYADTARQTGELVGWSWGGGLYLNYAFALLWAVEVIWWWTHPAGYRRRSSLWTWTVRGYFLFMIFNGAVVFAHGPVRWFGLVLSVTLVGAWARRAQGVRNGPSTA